MTIEIHESSIEYTNSGPGEYSFNFSAMEPDDILIQFTDSLGNSTLLVYGSAYTVSLIGDGSFATAGNAGGTVTLTADLAIGTLLIYRLTDIDQLVNWLNNDPFDMEILERAIDKLTLICQDLNYTYNQFINAFMFRGVWTTNTKYNTNDIVSYPDEQSSWYACKEEHTSATLFLEGYWVEVLDVTGIKELTDRAEAASVSAEASATSASASSLLASKWADEAQDVPVVANRFSAMHWAIKAQREAIAAGVEWFYPWIPGTYPIFTMTRNNGWTMMANKTTSDQPDPQPSGDPYFVYDDAGAGSASQTVKELMIGSRYTYPVGESLYVTGYRVYTIAGNFYRIFTVKEPNGVGEIEELLSFTANSEGWQAFAIMPILLAAPFEFDIRVIIQEPDPSPVIWSGNWNYTKPANEAAPGNGVIVHATKSTDSLLINHIDDAAVNRQAELEALTVGDLIDSSGVSWSIQAIELFSAYIKFTVAPSTLLNDSGILPFDFQTITATPITYLNEVDGYIAYASVQGLIGNPLQITQDAYGVDLKIQEANVSDDWDLVAVSDAAASGGGAPVSEAPIDNEKYGRKNGAWTISGVGRYTPIIKSTGFTLNAAEAPFNPLYILAPFSGAFTVTIPTATNGGYKVGDVVSFTLSNTNYTATLAAGSGLTLLPPTGKALRGRVQNSMFSIVYNSDTQAILYGDLGDA